MSFKPDLTATEILDVLATLPKAFAVYTTEDVVIQSANDAMLAFWGKDKDIIGMPLAQAVPELIGQPFIQMLQDVWNTGITNTGKSIAAETRINGVLQTLYYNYEYKAMKNSEGKTYAILHTAEDVTEMFLTQKYDGHRKKDFISMVSHELKTPLTSLTAYIQMLERTAIKNEDEFSTQLSQKAERQLKKMTSMINGFLNISRLESGQIHLIKQKFNLDELIVDMIEDARISASNYQFDFTPHAKGHFIYADRDKVGAVISNLLSNAVKYSPNKNLVTINCILNGDQVKVSIKDEGLGIDTENLKKLFDRFYRVENKDNPNISGFGIGLYLSAEIVQHHGGKISVESEKGKGSTFYFTLPL